MKIIFGPVFHYFHNTHTTGLLCGCCENKGSPSAVSIFYEAIHKRLESGKNTFVCFLDLRKAFDRINRELLFKKLVTLGVPQHLTKTIDYIYSKIRVSIKNGDKFSEEFVTSTGVPQGCPLSPLMYILFASDMKQWLTHKGVSLENLQLQFIQYADDIALMADDGAEVFDATFFDTNTILILSRPKNSIPIQY